MAFGAYVNMGNGRKLRASGAMAAPEVKKAATKAAARITKAVEGAREAIGDGTLIEHKPEVVGVRVIGSTCAEDIPEGRSYKRLKGEQVTIHAADGTEIAHFTFCNGVRLVFATKRRG